MNERLQNPPNIMAEERRSLRSYSRKVHANAKDILRTLLGNYVGSVSIELWDGEIVIGNESDPCRVIFRHPSVLRHLIIHQDIMNLAEQYLIGEVDVEGDIESLFDLVDYLKQTSPWHLSMGMLWKAMKLPSGKKKQNTLRMGTSERKNSRNSIAHHYDISNSFYRLWLDPEMVYSCAYFRNTTQDLGEAQHDKLDYICRKLRLAPGQTLLDIGCGWGSLIIWAAQNYGVKAHGITLSAEQYYYAQQRIKINELEDCVTVELQDYRDLSQGVIYDRIVSVGMFEHVGVANYPTYFETIKRALKPNGLFLNHGITSDTGWQETPLTKFINTYVFPDGQLARISDVINSIESSGFEILDVEGLRRHYALTLRHWVQALEEQHDEARKLVGEEAYRIWRLYMAGSAYYFEQGSLGVYQILVSPMYQRLDIPLRRADLYQ